MNTAARQPRVPRSKITKVIFTTLTEGTLQKYGVEITKCYQHNADTRDTPFDLRLGTNEHGFPCETCGNDLLGCSGHFGYIRIPYPVINPVYYSYINDMLKCVCYGCSNILLPEQEQERILSIYKNGGTVSPASIKAKCKKAKNCYVCDRPKKQETSVPLPPTPEIVRIFKKITNKAMTVLGFNKHKFDAPSLSGLSDSEIFWVDPVLDDMYQTRPESWIFNEIFPVVPPHARPFVIADGERKDDELTGAYNNVIKISAAIRDMRDQTSQKKKSKKTIEKHIADLEKLIQSIIENKAVAKSSPKDRKINSLSERIKGKDGHMQAHIGGKRSDFSGRMVIDSSGYWLRAGEIGIPRYVAEIITLPEFITSFNKKYFENMIRKECGTYKDPETGEVKIKYTKGNIVSIVRNGNTINVERATNGYTIPFAWGGEVGLKERDIVHRNVIDGDPVIANRQPSIREESMLGFSVRIHDDLVMKLPLCTTKAFNADFDGDEMNLHFPQSIGAQTEARFMMNVAQKIITRQSNGPIIGIVQNTLVSMYMLTRNGTMVDLPLAFDLFVATNISSERVFNLAKRCYDIPEYRQYVSIRNESASEYESEFEEYSSNDFYFSSTLTPQIPGKIVASIIFPETFTFIRATNVDAKFPFFKMEKGVILPDSGPMCKKIIGVTKSSCISNLWKRPYSPSVCIDVISELQILGLHYITRTGFSFGVTDCIPTSDEFIQETLNTAFVEVETINASNKTEFEKEGLINNALNKTMGASATLAKKHMQKGEDNSLVIMKVCGAKGTDVNNGQIAGFTGQQNLDGARIKRSLNGTRCLPTFQHHDNSPSARGFVANSLMKGLTPSEAFFYSISGRRGNIDTAIKTAECGYIQKKITKKGEDANQKEDGTIRDASGNIIQYLYGNDGFNAKKLVTVKYKGTDIPFFIDLKNLQDHYNNIYEKSIGNKEERCEKRKLFDEEIDFAVSYVYANVKVATEVTRSSAKMIATVLEELLRSVEIYEEVLIEFIEEIEKTLKDAVNETGESVGLVAGCSIGEPVTQMTLNTHQFVGVSEKEVMGVVRLKELLGATSNPSNPTMSIYLATDHREVQVKTSGVSSRSEEMRFKCHKNMLEMLEERGYEISDDARNTGIGGGGGGDANSNEVFYKVTKNSTCTQSIGVVYLNYDLNKDVITEHIDKKLKSENLMHLIVVYQDKITPSAADLIIDMKKIYRLEFFNIKEMQYNPLRHVLVPKHEICSKEEKEMLIDVYSIKTLSNFPGIAVDDPIVKRIGAVKGQLIKITRKDLVIPGGEEVAYRIVTSETN